jgi:hypothetical protein
LLGWLSCKWISCLFFSVLFSHRFLVVVESTLQLNVDQSGT